MPLKQILYLKEVIQCRSINQAAHNLYISPQALRSAIKSIEDKMGFKIFERSNQGLSLTPKGKEIEDDIYTIIHINERWNSIRDARSQVDGVVRLVAATSMCNTVVPDIMLECRKRYPDIQLRHYEARGEALLAMMEKKRMIGLIGAAPSQVVRVQYDQFARENNYLIEHLREDAFYVYINSKNPLANQSELTFDDLRQLTPAIYLDEDKRFLYRDIFKYFSPNPPYYLMHQEGIFQMVAHNPSVACIFPAIAEDGIHLLNGQVCPMTIRDYPMPAITCMIFPRPSALTNGEKAVLNLIREFVHDPLGNDL